MFLGIDIGTCYTKVVELERKPNFKLINYFIFKTPFLRDDPYRLDNALFWQEITRHIPQEKIRGSAVGINLPSSTVTAMTIVIPRVTKKEINIITQTEARRKMIPASGPQHIFESSLVGNRIVAKIPRIEALVARSENTYVQALLELFKPIHSYPKLITLSSAAFYTLLPNEIVSRKEVDTALIDIGLHSISTSILKEGRLAFFRNTSFGLKDIFSDMAKNLSLTEDEVEKIIQEKGVPETTLDLKNKVGVAEEIMRQKYEASLKAAENNQKEQINLLELRVLWQAHLERIVQELRRSFMYYKEQSEGRRVEYIYYLGGGAQIKNLVNTTVTQIGGQWHIAYPFKGLPSARAILEEENATTIYANAASLALATAQKDTGIEIINFLPRELKIKEDIAKRSFFIFIAKYMVIAAASLAALISFIGNQQLRLKVQTTAAKLIELNDISSALKDLNLRQKKIEQNTALLEEAAKKRQGFAAALVALANAIPQEVLLTQVSISKAVSSLNPSQEGTPSPIETYRITIKAEAFADYETATAITGTLRAHLEKTSYFQAIEISPLTLETITPQKAAAVSSEVRLTQAQTRSFTITAEIVSNSN